jgi:hypothetical protein
MNDGDMDLLCIVLVLSGIVFSIFYCYTPII